jgi:predicted HTH domain antitoxin
MHPVTLHLPDELLEALAAPGVDISRAAFEALAAEAYREQKISHSQLRRLLGYETRMEVDAFLKARGVELEYTVEDLERDRRTLREFGV